MPIFHYSGYRVDGSPVSGATEASGLQDAIAKIKSENIYPSEVLEPAVRRSKGLFQRVDESFVPDVTRQLSILLSSGVPLIEALRSVSAERRGFYRDMLISIRESVSGGSSLHRALEEYADFFPDFYVRMVEAGEQSGTLDKVLSRLADYLEGQSELRSRIRSSSIYPIFMIAVSIIVLSFLFTFVIPKIVTIFRDSKAALPLATTILINISTLFVSYWWLLLGCLVAAAAGWRKFLGTRRDLIDRLVIRLPGNIVQSLYHARFARTLGFLLGGGLPMLKALSLSARSIGNSVLERDILDAEEQVAEGRRLSASLGKFSPVLIQLISTGEKSGRLAESLDKAADAYEEEFSRRVHKAMSLFEPSLILVMGGIVLFIVLAVLLPIFQLNQLIK